MKLMVIDGNSIINRAFYGIRLLTTRSGQYTNAIYGFVTILNKLIADDAPDAICVTFDLKGPTFRHERYVEYKAHRTGMPDELAAQLQPLKDVLRAMNIPIYEKEGYEADDLIGTIAKICESSGDSCLIVTGDKDSLQLVSDKTNVKLVSTRGGQTITDLYDVEKFNEVYGFPPIKLIDLKALMGDSSDNIPGVSGVGEKTAKDLVSRFGGIDEIYANLETLDIRDSVRKKLSDGKEMAELSYELATIALDAPIDFKSVDAAVKPPNAGELYNLFLSLEFNKLIEKFGLTPGVEQVEHVDIEEKAELELTSIDQSMAVLEMLENEEYVAVLPVNDLQCVVFCSKNEMFYARADGFDGDYNELLNALFSGKIKKTANNNKELIRKLTESGLPHDELIFDVALAAYVLSPTDNSYDLEKLAVSYLGFELPPKREYMSEEAFSLLGDGKSAINAAKRHAEAIYTLTGILKEKLEKSGEDKLFYNIEMPLCHVLATMESEGFSVDRQMLLSFGDMLAGRISVCESAIYECAGEQFNINSTKKLGEILFDRLKLPPDKKTKTGYSTNIDVLEKLKGMHPIIEYIIDYRQLTKLKSTYADGLLKVIAPDGRIHTSFNMTATATGRLSSTEPNLQNIPVRTELGSELRKMFIARPGCVLVDADYSQIELRILAHISDDKAMIEAFHSGTDIHTVTASQVFGVPPESVTSLMRSRAKAVNFGIVYGISDFSLAEDIGVFKSEAKQYIEAYLEKYEGVRRYMSEVVENAREDGYVQTLFGRRRYLPELHSKNFNIRSGAERIALNTPIQGTAADIIKIAMIKAFENMESQGLRARLILQVHDELIVEAPETEADRVAEILTAEMQSVISLKVPLIAEAKIGRSWYDAK